MVGDVNGSVGHRVAAFVALLVVVGALGGGAWTPAKASSAAAERVVLDDGRVYDAYVPAATKQGQFYHYTCEFDAAWVVLKTFGYDVPFEEQLDVVGFDRRIEPYYEMGPNGWVIYGGDITAAFSGDYQQNLLARTTGKAMRKLFTRYGLDAVPVHTQAGVEAAIDAGALVWIKATADFLPGERVTWITPDGDQLPGVLGNDHAVVVMGYNADVVVIRDVLGPTDTNWNRAYEYEVPWPTFLSVWEAQGFDGLAVAPELDLERDEDVDDDAPRIQPIDVTGSA